MSVRQEILDALNDGNDHGSSDNELAGLIGRPLPSVRRTRLAMEREGLVRLSSNSTSYVLRWVPVKKAFK